MKYFSEFTLVVSLLTTWLLSTFLYFCIYVAFVTNSGFFFTINNITNYNRYSFVWFDCSSITLHEYELLATDSIIFFLIFTRSYNWAIHKIFLYHTLFICCCIPISFQQLSQSIFFVKPYVFFFYNSKLPLLSHHYTELCVTFQHVSLLDRTLSELSLWSSFLPSLCVSPCGSVSTLFALSWRSSVPLTFILEMCQSCLLPLLQTLTLDHPHSTHCLFIFPLIFLSHLPLCELWAEGLL